MFRRLLFLAAGLVLVTSACTADVDADGATSTSLAGTTTTSLVSQTADPSDLPGRLVVLDDGGDIATIEPDGSNPVPITEDAGESARYAQPFWSPGSDRLAWVEVTTTGFGVGLGDVDGEERNMIEMSLPPFYMYWSPDGAGMGVLHNGSQGELDLELVDVEAGTTEVVGSGAPLYFSWSPDSDRVVAHVQGETLTAIALDGTSTDLGPTAPGYQAPQWTPAGIFHLGENGLEVRDLAGEARVLATAPGPVVFVTNRQGTRMAVQSFVADDQSGISATLSETPVLPANSVVVLDVETGEVIEVTPNLSIGFFWSPDGEALLVLEPTDAESGQIDVLVWRGREATLLSTMAPHPLFVRDVLQFFDQYAQSLQLWSPDSSAFALVGAIDDDPGVWVHSIGGDDPVKVFDGSWAAWSNG